MNNKLERKTSQFLMPYQKNYDAVKAYDIYPSFKLEDGVISIDIKELANSLKESKTLIIDGYVGVNFDGFKGQLSEALSELNLSSNWVNVKQAFLSEEKVDALIEPFMGESDSIFGTRATIELKDFFNVDNLIGLKPSPESDINIIYGVGAQLAGWEGTLLYIDLPKNELQFRARAESIRNIAASTTFDMKTMYKRYYFVDWVVLNRHKKSVLNNIDYMLDGQFDHVYSWMKGDDFRQGLTQMARSPFRARPWFEPGVWGGTWIKDKINELNTDVKNYAWSFELITPENGIVFQSSNNMLEVSFDFVMFAEGAAVMGDSDYVKFGDEFPIRFDFLDTFDGGNLSVQCHPQPDYCKEHFGETITQEETYYILDRKNDSKVYLGFQQDIDPEKFEQTLYDSFNNNRPTDITKFVQTHPANKHDLFLIPPGTIHASGIDTLVLEISTTPYIFTFKMYDWVRPDLDGSPRPLNIEHGMKNLCFDRKGEKVKSELISKTIELDRGDDWVKFALTTHEKHTYEVNRYHFNSKVSIETKGKAHVLSLVEGSSIKVEAEDGRVEVFQFAESFVVPAAAKSYTVINNDNSEAMLVVAFMK